MAPTVLLTDTNRWAASSRVAINFALRGARVFGLCPNRHPLSKTRAVERTFRYSSLFPVDSLLKAIEAANPDLVIPCDDRATQHLHELYECARSIGASGAKVKGLIERSLGSPESYAAVDSRYEVIRISREEGIHVPETSVVNSAGDLRSWGAAKAFPWVLKAAGTWGGRGVRIVNSFEQADQAFLELTGLFRARRVFKRSIVNRDSFWIRPWWNRSRPDIVVQSHVQGRPANCAVACWEGRVLAGIGVEVVSALGPTEPAIVVRVVDNFEMMSAAERLVRRLGLSGLIGLDFMIEDSSGAAYLIEMNPRCTPLCHIQLGKGRDMIGALVAQLSGETFQEIPPVTLNDLIAYFPQAWDSKSALLEESYQDLPEGEPDLLRELRRPWPNRSLLYRLFSYVHQIRSAALPAPDDRLAPEIGLIHTGTEAKVAPLCGEDDQSRHPRRHAR
jgi:hypothetical protein